MERLEMVEKLIKKYVTDNDENYFNNELKPYKNKKEQY